MTQHHPLTIAQLKAKLLSIRQPHREHSQGLNASEKLALIITQRVGTIGFFFIILTWTVLWIGWNTIAPVSLRFDPFPAFVLWLFLSNLIQIMLMPLIMVGQNVQSKFDGIKSQADYEVNLKAEQEIETILQHLENHQLALDEIKELLKYRKTPE
jgi:uncharacterized membrane protein